MNSSICCTPEKAWPLWPCCSALLRWVFPSWQRPAQSSGGERNRTNPRSSAMPKAGHAEAVILVGSEGNSTWAFARSLHDSLGKAGFKTHTAAMNSFAQDYPRAKQIYLLTATYGDGEAPSSANSFLTKLEAYKGNRQVPVAVLGFGDRQFPAFCQFAQKVNDALALKGWKRLMPLATVNRQSAQEFARWGETLSKKLGISLCLEPVQSSAKDPCPAACLPRRLWPRGAGTDLYLPVRSHPWQALLAVPFLGEHTASIRAGRSFEHHARGRCCAPLLLSGFRAQERLC